MELEMLILNKKSSLTEMTYHMFSLMCGIWGERHENKEEYIKERGKEEVEE